MNIITVCDNDGSEVFLFADTQTGLDFFYNEEKMTRLGLFGLQGKFFEENFSIDDNDPNDISKWMFETLNEAGVKRFKIILIPENE